MRHASQHTGFLVSARTGALKGFSLGHDCGDERRGGVSFLQSALGLSGKPFPQGLEDRRLKGGHEHFVFEEYQLGLRDRRFKKQKPAAVLYCRRNYGCSRFDDLPLAERLDSLDANFLFEFNNRWFRTGVDDVVCAWDEKDGFCIHVQGTENVALLKELHAAFLRDDIAYGDGDCMGFLRKRSVFVLMSAVSSSRCEKLLEADKAALHLQNCIDACGIEKALADGGRKYYALSGAWRDGPDSELMFFLNPEDQRANSHGWFSHAELLAWIEGVGPVVDGKAIEALLKQRDPEWGMRLHKGLKALGVKQRTQEKFVWLDAGKSKIGVCLELMRDTEHVMASGTYPIEVLEQLIATERCLARALLLPQNRRRSTHRV